MRQTKSESKIYIVYNIIFQVAIKEPKIYKPKKGIYECDICHKTYKEKKTLNQHKKIHTGVKTFFCDQCDGSFYYSGSLNVHKKTHTGEKPFKCDICSKCFGRQGHLDRHLLIHLPPEEIPYKYECEVCHKKFQAGL